MIAARVVVYPIPVVADLRGRHEGIAAEGAVLALWIENAGIESRTKDRGAALVLTHDMNILALSIVGALGDAVAGNLSALASAAGAVGD